MGLVRNFLRGSQSSLDFSHTTFDLELDIFQEYTPTRATLVLQMIYSREQIIF